MRKRSEVGHVAISSEEKFAAKVEAIVDKHAPAGLEAMREIERAARVPGAGTKFEGAVVVPLPDGGHRVTVTWGEEKYSPVPGSYSSCAVGPYGLTFDVPGGVDLSAAAKGFMEALTGFAEKERDRKLGSFIEKLQSATQGAKR